MRRITFAFICTVLLMSPCLTFAVNEIGPIQTTSSQLEMCMAKCNVNEESWRAGQQPVCDFEIKWLNRNGNVLQSASFYDVPDQGSRELAYTLGAKLVSCRVDPIVDLPGKKAPLGYGFGEELSIAVLDNKGKTVAMMTNDRAEEMPMDRCNPCGELCIECALTPAPPSARAGIPQVCIDCQNCLGNTQ